MQQMWRSHIWETTQVQTMLDKNFMCCKFYVLRALTGRNIIVQATAKYSKSTGLGKPVAIKSKREKQGGKRVWQHHNWTCFYESF